MNADHEPDALRRALLLAGAAAALAPGLAIGQAKFPSRPVDFVVPWGAGGGADQLARRLGTLLEKDLGVSFPILNIPGATGNTGMAKLLAAPADGHTICVFIADTLGTLAGGQGRYKLSDLAPLGIMIRQPSGLFVKSDARWKSFDELLAEAKTRELKVGITGFGGPDEMHVVKFNELGAKFRPVPFAKPAERYASILGGHADVLIEQAGDVRSFLDANQMRPVVFFSDQPQTGFESVPLARNYGVTLAISQFRAIVMRAGTDQNALAVMSAAIDRAAQTPEFRKFLADELALPDSYIPAAKAGAFLAEQLALIEANLPKKS